MKRLILVDGNNMMFRAYYGFGDPTKMKPNSKGIYTNAILAFVRMTHNLLKQEYDKVLFAFDKGKHTFRHDIQQDYKAGRAHMPDEMRMQIAYLKDFLKRSNIAQYEMDEYEADDIIGTLSKKASDEGYMVDIYSSDKDLLQLIGPNTVVHAFKKGITEMEDYTVEHFREVYEIEPEQFIDLKALMGDTSDNISGVPGIGPKKGIKLLKEFGTVEGILSHIDDIKGKDKEKFIENEELLKTCKVMVRIVRDAPIQITLDDLDKKEPDNKALKEMYEHLELNSLLKEMALESHEALKQENETFEIVNDTERLKTILVPYSTIYVEAMESNYHKAKPLALGLKNHTGNYIIDFNLLSTFDMILFLSDKENHKNTFDYKRVAVILKKYGIDLRGVDFDLMLASYIINPTIGNAQFKNIASYFGYNAVSFEEEIYGKGAKMAVPEDMNIIYNHTIRKCNAIHILKNSVIDRLKENGQFDLYNDIELPLAYVLANMEYNGVKVDKDELNRQEEALNSKIIDLEKDIFSLAGEEFNINSPKQLGVVLFDHLGLYYPKKLKAGSSYSTDAETLEKIIDTHPIISKILEYRGVSKLKSTYIDGIRDSIYPDNMVHTIFQQALTQTGRLSSIEPNMQNIPIRTEEGKEIRKMFIPRSEGYSVFSSDYSQVELRVLAHMAGVKKLIEAFKSGVDVHTHTAQEIFGHKDITPLERRKAKAVNFGIVYGISAFGLAQDVHISNIEAQNYINKYFEIYPEIKEFMDDTIEYCKKNGYVSTICNRIRLIPDINSSVYMVREFAKRTAMNAPIQGSAADIMKIAMIKIFNDIEANHLRSKMIMQVHDEILIEVYKGEEEKIKDIVVNDMTNAVKLDVPLDVDYSFGANWYEVK